jgi:hypothetical protein
MDWLSSFGRCDGQRGATMIDLQSGTTKSEWSSLRIVGAQLSGGAIAFAVAPFVCLSAGHIFVVLAALCVVGSTVIQKYTDV